MKASALHAAGLAARRARVKRALIAFSAVAALVVVSVSTWPSGPAAPAVHSAPWIPLEPLGKPALRRAQGDVSPGAGGGAGQGAVARNVEEEEEEEEDGDLEVGGEEGRGQDAAPRPPGRTAVGGGPGGWAEEREWMTTPASATAALNSAVATRPGGATAFDKKWAELRGMRFWTPLVRGQRPPCAFCTTASQMRCTA